MNKYSSKKLFQLVNCEKSYSKKIILENINLQIEEGSFHALVGENGSGKSTLLKLMSGNELLDEGDILFANHSVFDIENPNFPPSGSASIFMNIESVPLDDLKQY